jgi:hypothetical protein
MEIFTIFAAMLMPQLSISNYMSNSAKFSAMTAASNVLKVGCTMESTAAPRTMPVHVVVIFLGSMRKR